MKNQAKKHRPARRQKFPPGWNEKPVRKVLAHYENQTEDDAVVEDESKQGRPRPTIRKASVGLLAIGSSGPWEIAIDQTTSGPERWFAQIDGPSVYLNFEIPSLEIIDQVIEFLMCSSGDTEKNAAPVARAGTLALGTGKSTRIKLVRDDEFRDRYFLVIEPKDGAVVRFTVADNDLAHVIDALRQVKQDIE